MYFWLLGHVQKAYFTEQVNIPSDDHLIVEIK